MTSNLPGPNEHDWWTGTGGTGGGGRRDDRRFQMRIALIGAAGAVIAAAVGAVIGLKPWSHSGGSPGQPSSSVSQPVPSTSPPSPPASSPPTSPVSTTPPPQLTYYFNFDGSSPYPCSDEGTIHSVINGPEEAFYFVNDSATYLQIIWLNDDGNRVIKDTLPVGGTWSGSFYIGDAWLIASPNATCQGIFVVDSAGEVTTTSS